MVWQRPHERHPHPSWPANAVSHYHFAANDDLIAVSPRPQAELMIDLINEIIISKPSDFSGHARIDQTAGGDDCFLLQEIAGPSDRDFGLVSLQVKIISTNDHRLPLAALWIL